MKITKKGKLEEAIYVCTCKKCSTDYETDKDDYILPSTAQQISIYGYSVTNFNCGVCGEPNLTFSKKKEAKPTTIAGYLRERIFRDRM